MYRDKPSGYCEKKKREEKRLAEAKRREAAFLRMEADYGKDAADALRAHFATYSDRFYKWLARLYDPSVGGFYFNDIARDTDGYLPDVESTKQAMVFFRLTGLTSDYPSLVEAYPAWMRRQVCDWVRGLQDPEDGYFYHPQWGKNIVSSRQGRDLDWATATLTDFGEMPIWDAPTGHRGEKGAPCGAKAVTEDGNSGSPVAVYPERLRTLDAWRRYLICELNENESPDDETPNAIRTKSYSIGNTISSQAAQILQRDRLGIELGELVDSDGDGIADDGYVRMLERLLNGWLLPYNGLWEENLSVDAEGNAVVDREGGTPYYNSINGLMKITASYNMLGIKFPYIEQALKQAMYMVEHYSEHEDGMPGPDVKGKRPSNVVDVYNPWVCIQRLMENLDMFYTPEQKAQMISLMKLRAANMIRVTTAKTRLFEKEDGSFGYHWGECGTVSQRARVSPPGFMGGDVNGGCIAVRGITWFMCNGLGVGFIPIFGSSDWDECIDIFEQLDEAASKNNL